MTNLKVKILKKSKEAPYPEHIIVEKRSSAEMAHLYFDQGSLVKFVYIQKEKTSSMRWNEQEKRYTLVPPSYTIKATYDIHKNKYSPRPPFVKGNYIVPSGFCRFSLSPFWNESTITFTDTQENVNQFSVVMDLEGKCKPNQFTEGWKDADIKTIYPHQKRRTCPTPNFLKKERS